MNKLPFLELLIILILMMQKNKFLLVFVIIFYFIAILGNIIDQYVSFLSWADELSAILLFVLYITIVR